MRMLLCVLGSLGFLACGPLQYVKHHPIVPPAPLESPELTVPVLSEDDCGAFTLEGGEWRSGDWSQAGVAVDSIEVGDSAPVVDKWGTAVCRFLAIPPGHWTTAREARDRYPLLRDQLGLWQGYASRQAQRQQQESEELARLVQMARRRQWESFAIGAGVGAGGAAALLLAVLLGGR